jgi:Ca-activated chloride channel family protein
MDMRIPLGTAAVALLLLPLGWQLYNSTSIGRVGVVPTEHETPTELATTGQSTAPVTSVAPKTGSVTVTDAPAQPKVAAKEMSTGATPQVDALVAPAPEPVTVAADEGEADLASPADSAGMARSVAPNMASLQGGIASSAAVPLVPTGDNFQQFDESRVKIVKDEPVSTFSIDVDTASYSYVRSVLEDGYLPEPDAVRLEEMINYFPYDYPAPTSADTPFKATMAVLPTPWNSKTELLEIGIKGYVPPAAERQPENLTFLIDTSGSMDEPNKLPLLKRAFGLLVDQLQATDTVSIVVYAGSAGVVLEPTKVSDRATILAALDHLEAGGSTAGAEGIELAYRIAEQNKIANGVNRVILATDGDFNVGISDPDDLKTYIKSKRDSGVFLSVLGFGRGNLDDALMQSLAQNGNGNASYIDNFREAQKVLVEEGGSTLQTIAKDVKVQVEFNPAVVSEYRLIGYETRALNREDFNNDVVDAGEIGAGHTVTALYEITPVGSDAELNDLLRYGTPTVATAGGEEIGFLKLRYKAPEGDVSKLISAPIGRDLAVDDAAKAGNDQRFAAAVAAFGQKLKGSNFGGKITWDAIAALANGAKGEDKSGYRAEFVQLIRLAKILSPDTFCTAPAGNRNCR